MTQFNSGADTNLNEAVKSRLLANADTNVLTDAELAKLAAIEAGATADQTGAEIKAAYESELDTNAFTDAEKAKLAGIEPLADVNLVDSVNGLTGAVVLDADDIDDTVTVNKFASAAQLSKIDGVEAGATADQTGAEIVAALDAQLGGATWQSGGGGAVDSVNTQIGAVVLDADDIDDAATVNKFVTAAQLTKIDGVEAGATADQTGAEIKAAYEAEADTNAFTDAEKTKLAGLDDNHYKGLYATEAALTTAHPTANPGDYAYVDAGVSSDTQIYAWDNDDSQWVLTGGGGSETAASIKTKYESNADTNAFTDADQTKLGTLDAVLTGAGVPATTPAKEGLLYVDTTNKRLYASVGTASSADWQLQARFFEFDAGGDPNAARPTHPADLPVLWLNHGNVIPTNLGTNDIVGGIPYGTSIKNTEAGATYTLTAADVGTIRRMTSGSANTVTIPTNATAAFPDNAGIIVKQGGTGATTVQAAAGVSLNGADGGSVTISAQYQEVVLDRDAVDVWTVSGGY